MKNGVITFENWLHSSNSRTHQEPSPPLSSTSTLPKSRRVDLLFLLIVATMVLFGLIMVYSSSFIYAQEKTGDGFFFIRKQLIFAGIGFFLLIIATKIPYYKWSRWAHPVLGLATLLLAMVYIPGIGAKIGGARRWLHIGHLSFQPGELTKFAILFFVAHQLNRKHDRLHQINAGVLSHFITPLPAFLLLLLQPDFGTVVVITIVIFLLMLIAGVPIRYLIGTVTAGFIIGVSLIFSSTYRHSRLMTFLDPWKDPEGKGFQILQSFIGLHQGQWWGVGLGNGKEKLFYLPEAHNDFILSVIGEELGFIGITCVALAYLFFLHRGLKIAWRCWHDQQDRFGMLLASGITLALGLQGLINMGVVLGLLPTKGLTLPFMSYGGSALLIDLFAVGVLLNISKAGPSCPKN